MTGKFEYKTVCKHCGKTFIAQKSTTKYCSAHCAKRAYKADLRAKQLQEESDTIKERNRRNLIAQEYLSITTAAALLSISRPTLYKMIAAGELMMCRKP